MHSPVDSIDNQIYKKEKTYSPPARMLRTPEQVEAKKAAAQAKRDRKNLKRLKNLGKELCFSKRKKKSQKKELDN